MNLTFSQKHIIERIVSFIHSGSILWLLRQKFSENPPSLGGKEKAWVSAYVKARHAWLAGHSRRIV
jgi:chitosanase